MKLNKLILLTLTVYGMNTSDLTAQSYKYEQVANDPLKARIYTLDNGLKVYMSVNKEEPMIQTYIGVRVGSKDDPSHATGLAHYFEHMMFKGTPNFGTIDWEKEKVLIQQIEDLFEIYRTTTDEAKRKEIYAEIDRVSFEASKLAIPNEYDKLMKAIGSKGTNAATSNDFTYYVENIPSNQLENWLKIQSDRFAYPVLRLFHTELETVYEEKNMSLTNDGRRVNEAMLAAVFPNHPYGTQTTLGHGDHLKNPSMKAINEFFKQYYVANNMAISIAGDFNPEQAIKLIDQYFGNFESKEIPTFVKQPLPKNQGPRVYEITGQEAENVRIAYAIPGIGTQENLLADMLGMILSNGKVGLIDININQKQTAVGASAGTWGLNDYGVFLVAGRNKDGQTLEEVKDLLAAQIELVKEGKFPDWMLEATINNLKLREISRFQGNRARSSAMVMSYLNHLDWSDIVTYNDKLSKITKEDIVRFANEYLKNDYVVVYKRQGAPDNIQVVEKPSITPIHINRDQQSPFYNDIVATETEEIKPVFVDFSKEITESKTKSGLDVKYIKNTDNQLFDLVYYIPVGYNHDRYLGLISSYINYLGTSKYTTEQFKEEFYKLACNYRINVGTENSTISVNGLVDTQEKAMNLLEHFINNAQVDKKAWDNLVDDIIKSRKDAKGSQRSNFAALVEYGMYGSDSPTLNNFTEEELRALNPQLILDKLKGLLNYKHEVLYFGASNLKDIIKLVEKTHKTPKKFQSVPSLKEYKVLDTTKDRVIFAHYEGPQSQVQIINKSAKYDESLLPVVSMYNAYFGGSMNAIVFQELREKRGLAYSATSRFASPSKPNENFRNISGISTQNDKVVDALNAFNDLFDNMPVSENAFILAKDATISAINTERINNMNIIWSYINARQMGRPSNVDIRKNIYDAIPNMTFNHIKSFNEQYIKNQPKTYIILGNEKYLDFEAIEKQFGPVEKVTQETYFGY